MSSVTGIKSRLDSYGVSSGRIILGERVSRLTLARAQQNTSRRRDADAQEAKNHQHYKQAVLTTACIACGMVLSPASHAELSVDAYVTRLEENPITMNGGVKRAITDTERMLLMQQDELRRLRADTKAPTVDRGFASVGTESSDAPVSESVKPQEKEPSPRTKEVIRDEAQPTVFPPEVEAKPVESRIELSAKPASTNADIPDVLPETPLAQDSVSSKAGEESSGGPGGLFNLLGILVSGVLGGLLYQNKKASEEQKDQLKRTVARKEQEAVSLKGTLSDATDKIKARENAAEKLKSTLEAQRVAAENAQASLKSRIAATEAIVADAKRQAARTMELNDALQVEVKWADELRSKEKRQRQQVEADRASIRKEKNRVEAEAAQLSSDLDASLQRSQSLQVSLHSERKRSEELDSSLKVEQARSAVLEDDLRIESGRSSQLQERLVDSMERVETLEEGLEEEKARSSELQKGLEASRELGRSLKGQLQEAQRDGQALQEALKVEEQENTSLRSAVAEEREKQAALDKRLSTTEESLEKEMKLRSQREMQLDAAKSALAREKEASATAAAASSSALQGLREEMRETEKQLLSAAEEREKLLDAAEQVKAQFLNAQDSVEEEQSVVMRMRRQIRQLEGKLQSAEIENEFLKNEKAQIRSDVSDLRRELETTRQSLSAAQADARKQRERSENTLTQLHTALHRIQVEAVVDADRSSKGGKGGSRAPVATTDSAPASSPTCSISNGEPIINENVPERNIQPTRWRHVDRPASVDPSEKKSGPPPVARGGMVDNEAAEDGEGDVPAPQVNVVEPIAKRGKAFNGSSVRKS